MKKPPYTLADFDFDLPSELIAQHPEDKRDNSRLFVLDRAANAYTHSVFSEIPSFLRKGDTLVLNNVRVMSARIQCRRSSGGSLELLLTKRLDDLTWTAITNRTKRIKIGESLFPVRDGAIELKVMDRIADSLLIVSLVPLTEDILRIIGDIALPPYIKRDVTDNDKNRYQTVYARESGAVAAPTAGFHFTEELFRKIRDLEVNTVFLTLQVSWGTFQPVRQNDITKHRMHSETYSLSDETAAIINESRKRKNRIIAVGTTSLRVLEATFHNGINHPGSGETDIFIYPPRKVLSVDALITNFHTPCSTLIMLVAAFAGYDFIMAAYREAIRMGYRFFSYGDAMFIQ